MSVRPRSKGGPETDHLLAATRLTRGHVGHVTGTPETGRATTGQAEEE